MTRYLVHYVGMIRLNVHEAKTHLSRYLARIEAGETILLCRRNIAIAEIRPLSARRVEPRPVGLWAGRFEVTDSFFEPLPPEIVAAFEGGRP